ncbi:MAG: helix-turn-helix domain-containing protein [Candidatus Gottesmanbacteria bacterium]|nr:helix-turn-helix domain-containing protein [Candidatus Gottesmanbacteria bacterium]
MDIKPIVPLKVYGPDEVAETMNVDVRSIYKLMKSGKLVSSKVGRKNVVLGENIMKFMRSPSLTAIHDDKIKMMGKDKKKI